MPEPPTHPDAEAEWLDYAEAEFDGRDSTHDLGRKVVRFARRKVQRIEALERELSILRGDGGHLERPHYVEPVNSELRLEPFADLGD